MSTALRDELPDPGLNYWAEPGYLSQVEQDDPGPDDPPATVAAPAVHSDDTEPRNVDDMTPAEYAAHRFNLEVTARHRQLQINQHATRLLRGEHTADPPPPQLLADYLAVEDQDVNYRVDGLLPVGGRAMLAAAFKAGKTTMMGNLIRCLADGDMFLDEHEVATAPGPIVLLDTELDDRMLRRWLRQHRIQRTDRVIVVSLRGKLSSFDITDPHVLQRWADTLAQLTPSMVILDPLRPILDAIGLDEDKEAGRFLVAFDELLDRAGASEAVVVHHMGHSGERARGSSRLRDWPDAEWRLVRGDPDDPASPRFFTAYGRDVDQAERELTYNPDGRRLTIFGSGRKDGALKVIVDEICEELAAEGGLSRQKIERRLGESGHTRANVRAALARGVADRLIVARSGPRTSVLHYLAGGAQPIPDPWGGDR